jgi:hypothetical protein
VRTGRQTDEGFLLVSGPGGANAVDAGGQLFGEAVRPFGHLLAGQIENLEEGGWVGPFYLKHTRRGHGYPLSGYNGTSTSALTSN